MRGMPTRRGQSFSGAPKSVNLEKQFLPEKSLIDFRTKIGSRSIRINFSIAIVIAICK